MKLKITAIICAASILLTSVSVALAADGEPAVETTDIETLAPLSDTDTDNMESTTSLHEATSPIDILSESTPDETIPVVTTLDESSSDENTTPSETITTGTTSDESVETTTPDESSSPDEDEPEVEESVQSIIYRYLTEELGLCSAAAAGIMGNVMIECGFDPSMEVIDTNNKPSFGIMMWNGPRYEALKKWCEENGFDKTDPKGQMGYLKWELENTEKASYASMKNIPDTAEGAVLAAILWADEFERCTKTSYGLRVFYALNNYWQDYAGGSLGESEGVYGYYYNVPKNIKVGEPLTLYGAIVSYTSPLKSISAGVYTEDGKLVTGRTMSATNHVGNIGVLDRFIVLNKLPKGKYYYTITAKNETDEYVVERYLFTVSDSPTKDLLIYETEGGGLCEMGASCPSFRFLDMTPITHWSHGDIDFVLSNEFFLGNGAGYFLPETNMSRSMFVTVLHRLSDKYSLISPIEVPTTPDSEVSAETTPDETEPIETELMETESTGTDSAESEPAETVSDTETTVESESLPTEDTVDPASDESESSTPEESEESEESEEPEELPFTDVIYDSWYGEHVLWAYEFDLVKGKGNGIFDPNGEITRGELAVLMYRVCEKSGIDVSARADLTGFADAESVPDWAREEMSWAVAIGLVNGTVNGGVTELSTMNLATREQVSAIVRRLATMLVAEEINA